MPLDIDTLTTDKKTRRNITTILKFTRKREAENLSQGLRSRLMINFERSSDLYERLKDLADNAARKKELDNLINQCVDIIEESSSLSDEQKKLLLTEIERDHGDFNKKIGAAITALGIIISITALIVLFEYPDVGALIFVATGVLDAFLVPCVALSCNEGDKTTAESESYFMQWAANVAQKMNEIEPTSSLLLTALPVAAADMDENSLEMQPIQSSFQALAMPKTGYIPVPSGM